MAVLTKAAIITKFNDSLTGLFKDNALQEITATRLRDFVADITDNALFVEAGTITDKAILYYNLATESISDTGWLFSDTKNLKMPQTASSAIGVLKMASNNLLHRYGNANLFIGSNAGNFSLTGGTGANLSVGDNTLYTLTTGILNVAFGKNAGEKIASGNNAVFIGVQAGRYILGTDNVAVGTNALNGSGSLAGITGQKNVAIGFSSLFNIQSGSNNIAIGWQAADNITTGSGNILIGYDLDVPSATGSNQLNIGGLLFGDMGANKFVGINNTAPGGALDIVPVTAAGILLKPYGASAGNTSEVRLFELAASGTNYTGFKSPDALAGNVIYTLPIADGTKNYLLTTDGAGNLSWAANVLFTSTASATVANSTSETSIVGSGVGNMTLPANYLIAGRTMRVVLIGYVGTDATPGNITLNIKLGGTTICTTGAIAMTASLNNRQVKIEAIITCRTTGGSGSVMGQGEYRFNTSATAAAMREMVNTAIGSIDTTASLALAVTAQWSIAHVNNTITISNVFVQSLN